MLDKDIIERGPGEFGPPVVLVKAPNKAPRLTFDLCIVNHAITFEAPTSISNISDLLVKLRHAKTYPTFNITKAYHPIDERLSEILSVSTTTETYRMKRLPFGLHLPPHIFARILKDVLSPMDQSKLITYLDDICLIDTSIDGLLEPTAQFLECIQKNSIRLSPQKCNLFATEIIIFLQRHSLVYEFYSKSLRLSNT